MHIVFLVDAVDSQNAGVFVYVKNLILAVKRRVLAGDGNTYSFVHLRKNKIFEFEFCDGSEIDDNVIGKINDYIVSRRRIFGYDSFRRFFLIPRLVKKLGADVVIETCHIGPFGLSSSVRKGVVIHDITPVLFPKWHVWRSVFIHKLLLGRVVKNVDFIITPSECTKRDICDYYGVLGDKICVAYLSVDLMVGGRDSIDSNCELADKSLFYDDIGDFCKNSAKLKSGEQYILYLGTIEPRKNLEFFVENYLDMLKQGLITQRLVLAGGRGWKMGEFYEKYSENKNIVFTGYVDDKIKQALYKNADLFVYPSLYEGFGIPPLEALNFGIVPVLASASSLFEVYENVASFFELDDRVSFQIAVLSGLFRMKIYEKLNVKVGDGFVGNFSWDKMVEEIVCN